VVAPRLEQALGSESPLAPHQPNALELAYPFYVSTLVLAGGVTAWFAGRPRKPAAVRAPSEPPPVPAGAAPFLRIMSGPHAGRVMAIKDGTLIGRSGDCAIRLTDEAVSRLHARLRYASDRWFIQDMGSAGGTFLNGVAIKAGGVKAGDRIRVGSTEFELHT
jgi:hypothetical protein